MKQILESFLISATIDDPDKTLDLVGGTYDCPKEPDGKRIGPLVGYAGKYDDGHGERRQFVGEFYADFAFAEQYPKIYAIWAERMAEKLSFYAPDVMLGAPMGGLAVAQALACQMSCRYVYPEKVVVKEGPGAERGEEKFVLKRHYLNPGERVAICEDVTNNLSTTGQLTQLVREQRCQVVVISSWWNRSAKQAYQSSDEVIPIESLLHKQMPQYRQDDPFVAMDVEACAVVWKPKDEFLALRALYENHRGK